MFYLLTKKHPLDKNHGRSRPPKQKVNPNIKKLPPTTTAQSLPQDARFIEDPSKRASSDSEFSGRIVGEQRLSTRIERISELLNKKAKEVVIEGKKSQKDT